MLTLHGANSRGLMLSAGHAAGLSYAAIARRKLYLPIQPVYLRRKILIGRLPHELHYKRNTGQHCQNIREHLRALYSGQPDEQRHRITK